MFWPFDFWRWGSGVEVIPPPPVELTAELEIVAVVDVTPVMKSAPSAQWFTPVATDAHLHSIEAVHIFSEHVP